MQGRIDRSHCLDRGQQSSTQAYSSSRQSVPVGGWFGSKRHPGSDASPTNSKPQKAWEDCDSKITGARREDPAKLSTWAKHYAKDKTIVLYCSCDNEGTSKHVVKQLRSGGFEDAYALTGGWKAWIEADYPTEKKS